MKPLSKLCHLVVCLSIALSSLYASAVSGVTLSLLPSSQTGAPGDLVSLDLVIDGLGDFAPDSLGDFDIDIAYDPAALTLSGFILGDFLGDIGLGEALDFSGGDLGGGLVNLAEVSLLEPAAATCIFCIPPYLDEIQPGSFALATLDFTIGSLAPGSSTTVGISTVNALGDGFGLALPLDNTLDAIIRRPADTVPEPGSLILLLAGIGAFALLRRRAGGAG